MELIAIANSSNIRAIGYDPATQVLRVAFHDGAEYDYQGIGALAYANLMASPSKGAYLAQNFGKGVKVGYGGEIRLKEPYIVGAQSYVEVERYSIPGPLETFAEDDCCQKYLMKANRKADTWTCVKCGCLWQARMVDSVRHWEPKEAVMVW